MGKAPLPIMTTQNLVLSALHQLDASAAPKSIMSPDVFNDAASTMTARVHARWPASTGDTLALSLVHASASFLMPANCALDVVKSVLHREVALAAAG